MLDLVKFINTGDLDVYFRGNDTTIIAAGETKIVRWEFARAWFGDPTLDDPAERLANYKSKLLLWGYEDGLDSAESWARKLPTIEVRTLDDEQIWMLLYDPDRVHPMPGIATGTPDMDTSNVDLLRQQIQLQQQRMDQLISMVEGLTTSRAEELNPSELTALSTVDSRADQANTASASELPKPVATPKNATDKPQAVKVR